MSPSGRFALVLFLALLSAPPSLAQGSWDDWDGFVISAIRPSCVLTSNIVSPFPGQSIQLTATCKGRAGPFNWSGPGIAAGTVSLGNTLTVTTVAAGPATYSVIAKRGALSSRPALLSITVVPGSAPSASWATAPTGIAVPNAPLSFSVQIVDTDIGQNVATQFFVNDVATGPPGSGATNFTVPLNWTPTESGVYLLRLRATDAGSLSSDAVRTVVVADVPVAENLPLPATSSIGTIPGTFAVSDAGAAIYRMPIAVPPGAAGLQPDLSLVYSSQAGDGALGIGWQITGLSVIQRCPKTIAADGYRAPINYDNNTSNDEYCLDGERLIRISGTGASGEYRTERDSYAKIVAYDESPLVFGPSRFRVWTKDGRILDFGSRWWVLTDGQSQANRYNSVRFFLLDQVWDRSGNRMTIDYDGTNRGAGSLEIEPTRAGCQPDWAVQGAGFTPQGAYPDTSFFPTAIAYTMNAAAPNATRQFVYFRREPREESVLFDSGAGQSRLAERITQIETYINAAFHTEMGTVPGCNQAIDV